MSNNLRLWSEGKPKRAYISIHSMLSVRRRRSLIDFLGHDKVENLESAIARTLKIPEPWIRLEIKFTPN